MTITNSGTNQTMSMRIIKVGRHKDLCVHIADLFVHLLAWVGLVFDTPIHMESAQKYVHWII